MKFLQSNCLFLNSIFFVVSLLMGCKEDEPKISMPLNSFSMQANGEVWTPYQEKDDPCNSTYSVQYADYGIIPLYTIYAYRDPAGRYDAYSENLLRMRVMNVTEPGMYPLDGTYKEDFDSYIIFAAQQPTGDAKRFVNDTSKSSFVVNVQELTPGVYSSTKGIKGSFSGILYNEADPSDSLTIEKGEFTFKVVGANYDHHCDD